MVHRFVLGADQARERVDKALTRLMPDVSRSTIQRWIMEGHVFIDGRRCRSKEMVRAGSTIDVEPGLPLPSRAEPDPSVAFSVLYEDDDLIVIDKPAGLVVHPARGHATGTLVNGLLAREGFSRPPSDPRDPHGMLRPGIVHRIDKETSGILVVAKAASARESLKAQLAEHTVEREYTAITWGVPPVGMISTLHGRHPRSRLRYTSRVKRGRPAITHVVTAEPLAAGRAALVRCRLETGRTHQIRVHMAEQTGTPIFADKLYARRPLYAELAPIAAELGRQALHAGVLGFIHPTTFARHRFEVPLPADVQRALDALRRL